MFKAKHDLWFFVFFVSIMHAKNHESFTVILKSSFDELAKVFDVHVPDSMHIRSLLIDTDVPLSRDEFIYLTDIGPNTTVSRKTWIDGFIRLQKKRIFKKAKIQLKECSDGFDIHICLYGAWRFRALKISGLALGKVRYTQQYHIDPGDVFVYDQHIQGIKNMKKVLNDQGYFGAQIDDYLTYDEITKAVDAHILLDLGVRYFVRDVHVHVQMKDNKPYKYANIIAQLLYTKKIKRLCGRGYTYERIERCKKDILKYLGQKGFVQPVVSCTYNLNHDQKSLVLACDVVVSPRRYYFFFGNNFFSKEYLAGVLQRLEHHGGMLPTTMLEDELVRIYKRKGFWNTSISAQKEDEATTFVIKENERAYIDTIIIQGVLDDHVAVAKQFFKKMEKNFFDEEKMKVAIDNFVRWCHKQGYWDARCMYQKPVLDKNKHSLSVCFEEGIQRWVSHVSVEHFTKEIVDLPYKLDRQYDMPIPFDMRMLTVQRKWLLNRVQRDGYPYACASYDLLESDGTYEVIWHIDRGKQVTFGKTIICGVTRMDPQKIRGLVAYQQGQPWKSEKIQETIVRLRSTRVFERVAFMSDKSSYDKQMQDSVISLYDDDPFEVRTRMGFQQISKNFAPKKGWTYKCGGSFVWKNPTFNFDRFDIDVDISRFERRMAAMYTNMWGWRIPLLWTVKAYNNKYTQPVAIGSKDSLYEVQQQGMLTALTIDKKYFSSGVSSGFEWMKIQNVSVPVAQAINFDPEFVDKKIPYCFIEPNILVNLLNNPLYPTAGFFGVVSCKAMIPLYHPDLCMIKFLTEQSVFIHLYKPFVLAMRVRFGHIFRRIFSKVMPPERFYLGGAYSLRGYETDYCPPLGQYVDGAGIEQWVPQGGKSMLNINLELRYPLAGSLGGVIFQDFGFLSKDTVSLSRVSRGTKSLAASGFGFRYNTPVGPLRFDIGWRWHKEVKTDPSHVWFLTFGQAF